MWSVPIDLYCERTDPSFWSEPLNAWTNASFLIAALVAFLEWRRHGRDLAVLALIAVTAIVGIGSFIFHTVATRGAVLLDIIPIAIFIHGYLLFALRRFLRLGWISAAALVIAFFGLGQALDGVTPPGFLNGSGGYLPALAALLVMAGLVAQQPQHRLLWLSAIVFLLSIAFRSVDLTACTALPAGTHFLWHCLNGLVLYLLLRAANASPRRGAPA